MSKAEAATLRKIIDAQGPLGNARLARIHESAMTTTAQAGLLDRPTTLAHITFFNGEAPGGASLVFDRLFCFQLVSDSADQGIFTMWYCNHTELINVAKPTNDIAALRGTGDGREPDVSVVRVDAGATVLDDGWFPCGGWGEIEEAGILPGGGTEWECNGRIIVPPKSALSIAVSSSFVADTFTAGASWWRMQL